MKSVYNLETGFFVGNFPINELPENSAFADINYQLQFIVGKWNGTEWVEGATAEEIAEQELEQQKLLKQQQYEELLLTDWYVIRFLERGIPIPEEITQQRQEILNRYS
jgi:hypothetical protein